jgi:hypothetical protein
LTFLLFFEPALVVRERSRTISFTFLLPFQGDGSIRSKIICANNTFREYNQERVDFPRWVHLHSIWHTKDLNNSISLFHTIISRFILVGGGGALLLRAIPRSSFKSVKPKAKHKSKAMLLLSMAFGLKHADSHMAADWEAEPYASFSNIGCFTPTKPIFWTEVIDQVKDLSIPKPKIKTQALQNGESGLRVGPQRLVQMGLWSVTCMVYHGLTV